MAATLYGECFLNSSLYYVIKKYKNIDEMTPRHCGNNTRCISLLVKQYEKKILFIIDLENEKHHMNNFLRAINKLKCQKIKRRCNMNYIDNYIESYRCGNSIVIAFKGGPERLIQKELRHLKSDDIKKLKSKSIYQKAKACADGSNDRYCNMLEILGRYIVDCFGDIIGSL